MQRICKFYAAGNCNKPGCTFIHQRKFDTQSSSQVENVGPGFGSFDKQYFPGKGGYHTKPPSGLQSSPAGFKKAFEPKFCEHYRNSFCNKEDCK